MTQAAVGERGPAVLVAALPDLAALPGEEVGELVLGLESGQVPGGRLAARQVLRAESATPAGVWVRVSDAPVNVDRSDRGSRCGSRCPMTVQ